MADKPSILILEENQLDIKILQKLLHSYELTFMDTVEDAVAFAKEHLPELVIVDGMMPGERAHTLCRMLKQGHYTAKIAVLFMYASITAEEITQMFQSGGADYINKPFNQVELQSRVHVHIQNNKQRKRLELLAMYDPMTMCYNRRTFFEQAQKQMEQSHKQNSGLSITVFDITSFPEINYEYGHFAGDDVLKEFAKLVRSIMPNEVIFGRLSGKTFGAVTPGSTLDDDILTAGQFTSAASEIDVRGSKMVDVQFGIARKLSIEDTVDSVLLRAVEKIKNCYVARTERNY